MEVEHEIVTRDGEPKSESFWLRTDHGSKVLTRGQMIAAFEYVRENPDKFPEINK